MLILASNSPRRNQLLALTELKFTILPAQLDERIIFGEKPVDYVYRLAKEKARATASLLDKPYKQDSLVIAADTAVVDDLDILGKPTNAADAEKMLRRLRGRNHQVYTALAIFRPWNGETLSDICLTDVPMRNYQDEEMMAYIASGDPMDKAGAYAIQHNIFKPVECLKGCFANVMGLPLCHLTRSFARVGIFPETNISVACQAALDYSCGIFQQVLTGMDV
jgi:septum formation protein